MGRKRRKAERSSRSSFRAGDVVRFQRECMPEEREAEVRAVHPHGLELWDDVHEFVTFESSYIARKINGRGVVTQPELPLAWDQRYCVRCERQPATARSDYCRDCQDERKRASRRRSKNKHQNKERTNDYAGSV